MVHSFLYDILWNEKEYKARIGQQIDKEKVAKGLHECITLSHFGKQTLYEKLYLDEINQVI